ncbi:hypothetical protein GXP67_14475 [Rhodocytophaga rosea]|uniref:Uncharacterized protein n=1 Tax=Rhodocytophaga rosea TaxID=2704465 RepID=A0A6C0GJA9_9BACT|nr:hypothetical protein [Rhodocytophaga rosea]QHT67752.1 hypothetical protein GXP67_14475 [Rhodocytophaga rosea]
MTIPQSNKLTMYEGVLETLNVYNSVWKNTIVISEAVNEFSILLPQIRKTGATKATSTKGITQAKVAKKQEMADRAYKLAGLTSAYASKSNNVALQASLDYSHSDLFQTKDNLAIDHCMVIYNQIRPLVAELKPYGITAAELDALQTTITAFQTLIGQKGQQQSGMKVINQSIETLFQQADNLLKTQLDKLMLRYTDTNREFYDAYFSSRITRHLGGSRKPASVKAA